MSGKYVPDPAGPGVSSFVSETGAFWSMTAEQLLAELAATPEGLTGAEARSRLLRSGDSQLDTKKRSTARSLLVNQFKSPIILLLVFASILSGFLGDPFDAVIILAILLASGFLGFWQERGAADAVEKLLAVVQVKSAVMRDGKPVVLPVEETVPGDVILLSAGNVIPGDCFILQSRDLYTDEASLTGETYPVAKTTGGIATDTPLSKRTNTLFMGTHVISGTATCLVVRTGKATEFGKVSARLQTRPTETEFESGVRHFGYLLMEVTLVLVLAIFAVNVFFNRSVLESFFFALALAVGLTPQLLPAIVSVNLAQGAKRMAQNKVIVKRLAAIEDFGSMNVLCSDKTGTLTEGKVSVHSAQDISGQDSDQVLLYAFLNASFESGFTNPIDEAIRSYCQSNAHIDISGYRKLDEIPYDFIRKRLSILTTKENNCVMVTKGSVENVLSICSWVQTPEGKIPLSGSATAQSPDYAALIKQRHDELGEHGLRTLGVACRQISGKESLTRDDESEMTFVGFLVLYDPPKQGVAETISHLRKLGVTLKLITGDSLQVAASVFRAVGLGSDPGSGSTREARTLTGQELHQMSEEALLSRVNEFDLFAEVEPIQKERILRALRKSGNVVGYIGDGINDASAMHAADVSISVESAVDVAKETADILLLERDLAVLTGGIVEGRRTFANTLKYVFITTSANFGNMFSMAGVSLFLPFLPLLAKQILLNNFLTDLPALTIAADSVDDELVSKPRRWDIKFIRNFMLVFGLQSSIFDFLTFGVLLLILNSTVEQFRTGWFLESAISEVLILLVIRTRKPFFRSKPGKYLTIASLTVSIIVLLLPYTPLSEALGFVPLPIMTLVALLAVLALYISTAEIVKRFFYRAAQT